MAQNAVPGEGGRPRQLPSLQWHGTHTHEICAQGENKLSTGEDRLWKSKFYILFQPQKWASNKSNSSCHIILRMLRFLAESSGVTNLELFQPFPHCKQGFSRCTDSARLRQDSAAKEIKAGTSEGHLVLSHILTRICCFTPDTASPLNLFVF